MTRLPEQLRRELARLNIRGRVERGSRHPRLVINLRGRVFRLVYAGTPGDRRSLLNSRAQLRRFLRRQS